MPPHAPEPNESTQSTTWEWKRVKIAQPPQAQQDAERSESTRSLLSWPRKRPQTLTLVYRGGPEAWWEIRARGRVWRRPGVTALHDIMCTINQWKR